MKHHTLWSKNFSLLIFASTLGSIGGIAGSYAMRFLVFDETGSTFAAGLLGAIQIVPYFLLPIIIAPWMDRMPRKPILVGGDLIGGVLYGVAGVYLHLFSFSYPGYLAFSLVVNCVNAFDSLAFTCIFPKTIPQGFEDKGYAVSAMLYPIMNVILMPVAAYLMDLIGVANILMLQGGMSILAAITENNIIIEDTVMQKDGNGGFHRWFQDFKDGFRYLKGEKGLLRIYTYSAVTNGVSQGYGPILVAFFRSTPGFSAQLYAFFSAAEFVGRSIGGMMRYCTDMPPRKRRGFVYFVQQFYNAMDGILLWLPYPLMLINRGVCGFLGINSATVRESSIQQYLPEEYRARVNAFSEAAICAAGSVMSLLIGMMGEFVDYRIAISVVAAACGVICWLTVGKDKGELQKIYLNSK